MTIVRPNTISSRRRLPRRSRRISLSSSNQTLRTSAPPLYSRSGAAAPLGVSFYYSGNPENVQGIPAVFRPRRKKKPGCGEILHSRWSVSGLALRRVRRRDRQGELRRESFAVPVRDKFAAEPASGSLHRCAGRCGCSRRCASSRRARFAKQTCSPLALALGQNGQARGGVGVLFYVRQEVIRHALEHLRIGRNGAGCAEQQEIDVKAAAGAAPPAHSPSSCAQRICASYGSGCVSCSPRAEDEKVPEHLPRQTLS